MDLMRKPLKFSVKKTNRAFFTDEWRAYDGADNPRRLADHVAARLRTATIESMAIRGTIACPSDGLDFAVLRKDPATFHSHVGFV
ncbi:hypothetical protein EJB05_41284, partial [Eragrostis curvula]